MKFSIDKRIFEKFSDVNIGVVIAKGINNSSGQAKIENSIRAQEQIIRDKYTLESLAEDLRIDAWRRAYKAFGAKPKEHRSSVENLYRLVLSGRSLRHINNLVDSYNLISLKYMLPVGGEDLDKIQGDILLTLAGINEPPVRLLGDQESRPPHEGEVIYKDNLSAICRRWANQTLKPQQKN